MRFLLKIVIGGFVGAISGFAIPVAFGLYLSFTVPEFNKGGGTPLALMMLVTIPGFAALGVILGAIIGAYGD
jgi:hypothetical protein